MKTTIFIDKTNAEQVKWWNNIAFRHKLVWFELIDVCVDNTTGEETGYMFEIRGLLKHFVVRRNSRFISNSKKKLFS